jgi:hypothetical protein
MSESPDDVVGHKTIYTGEQDDHGFPKHRHEPLTRSEANAMWKQAEQAKAKRALDMPDVQSAINAMWSAHQRLQELGWREAIYCPKDGSEFEVIEPGSTGIHKAYYQGEWPNGSWNVLADGDVWPSHPILFRLYPEDQAKEDERKAECSRRFKAAMAAGEYPFASGESSASPPTNPGASNADQ